MAVFVAACSGDGDERGAVDNDDVLQLLAYRELMSDETGQTTTRAGELSGYSLCTDANTTIAIYMTNNDESVEFLPSVVYYANDTWHSQVNVKSQRQYYIYGFMPANVSSDYSIEPNSDYSAGATIQFKSLSPVSKDDFCVLTGVQGMASDNEALNLQSGNFSYTGRSKGENYANLMFEHAYAGILFKMKIGSKYEELRTIKLKEVLLRSRTVYQVSWSLRFNPGNTAQPVSFFNPDNIAFAGEYVSLYTSETGDELKTDKTVDVWGYYFPVSQYNVGRNLQLRCVYDVYDKKGNLIRENSVADNVLPQFSHGRGQMATLTLTVEPTYLYVLSDPDLDNPTIKVSEN